MRLLDEWLVAERATIGHQLICQNLGAIANLIVGDVGLGFLPDQRARELINAGHLHHLEKFPPLKPLPYAFHWRRDDTRPMVEMLRAVALAHIDFAAPRLCAHESLCGVRA